MVRLLQRMVAYLKSLTTIFCVLLIAMFTPKLFVYYAQSQPRADEAPLQASFKLGLENISPSLVKSFNTSQGTSYKVGLITNQTGKDQHGNRNIDVLRSKGINIAYIFTPKHGFHADKKGTSADRAIDHTTNIPLIAWDYVFDDASLQSYAIKHVDVLAFDMQDSGMRQGYVTTLLEAMKIASSYNKKMIVFDRPNLLGHYMEGLFVEDELLGNTPGVPIPLRHGMTSGELAHYLNKYVLSKSIDLQIVPMENYHRTNIKYRSLLSGNLSPNIPTIDACYGYSLLGLLGEIAPFDVGIGTDKVFQCITLPESIQFPKQKWYELRSLLKDQGVESRLYRYYSQRKKQYCSGLTICIRDINDFSSFSTLLVVVTFFKNNGVKLSFSSNFDVAVGTAQLREYLEGSIPRDDLGVSMNAALRNFFHKAASSFMYTPLPKVVTI
ncbi:MAG: exo-beta-N-acetylmuramidase NamZ domain-containing protein [Candidatus Babeliales bacterium]